MKIAIFGANGRMGKELASASLQANCSVCQITRENWQPKELLASDVIIDFTTPSASAKLLDFLLTEQRAGKNIPALLVGTTGLEQAYFDASKELKCPFFWASNTSIGVAVLTELSRKAASLLDGFDIEISEHHHRYKADAPSGTAKSIASELAQIRAARLINNRSSARNSDEIGVVSTRGGDVAGRHVVGFYSDGEWLELQHYASSRSIFAKGAVRIAFWLVEQKSGSYGMRDFIATVL